jgi:serine protease Do
MPMEKENSQAELVKSQPVLRRRLPLVAALAGVSALALITVAPPPGQVMAQLAPSQSQMSRAPLSFADIVEKVKPAVVSISVTGAAPRLARNDQRGGGPDMFPDLPDDHPLKDFFKNLPKEFRNPEFRQGPTPRPTQAQGSGFVVSPDGYVVTNNHVIDGATKVTVTFDHDEKYDAELIGTDARTDIALLKITNANGKTFPYVKFAEKTPRVGDWVVAVGNPFGLGGTVTAGIVSALARDIGSGPYDYMQIDAAVNRGNSGGPTFNLDGEVVGVNTAIYSPSGGNVGIAFAVPAKTANEVVGQLKDKGSVSRGWLGVKIQSIDEDVAASLGLRDQKGALVNDVTPNGPAAAAGVRTQDAILSLNGDRINDSRDLARKVAELSPNSTVELKVLRNNKEQTIKVKLGTFPGTTEQLAKLEQGKSAETEMGSLGLSLTQAPKGKGGKSEGVAISEVDSSSHAASKGLKAGDVILEVNSQPVSSPEDVESAVKAAKNLGRKSVLLTVKSADSDQKRIIGVQMKG